MKKLFTLIALAMSFVGGYAQGTYCVAESEKFTVGQVIESVPNLKVTLSDSDTGFADGKKKANYADPDFKAYTTGKSSGSFTEGTSVSGCYYKFEPNYSGSLVVGVVLDKNKQLIVVDQNFNSMEYTYNLPSAANGQSQSLNEEGKLALKSYGTITFNVKAGQSYSVVGLSTKLGFCGVKYSLSLTTAASGFATLEIPFAVDYRSLGLDAYAITLDEANMKVKYNKIDGVVPANTPVLVKGEASKTYSLTKATTDGTSLTTDLQVSDGTITGDGSTIYAFGTKNGVSGFKVVASGVKIPAKKGYLKLSSSVAAKDFFAFGGETTGISNILANGVGEEETPLFNLAGQRVDKSYKGVVVKNGKKFVNK